MTHVWVCPWKLHMIYMPNLQKPEMTFRFLDQKKDETIVLLQLHLIVR